MVNTAWARRPLPPRPEDAARWAEFCESVVDRIEAFRMSECPDPVCPTCGSSAYRPERWCSICYTTKPLSEFTRDKRLSHGRAYGCKACRRVIRRERYRREKIAAVRASLREAV